MMQAALPGIESSPFARLARMLSVAPEDLRPYLENEDVTIVEASIGALSRLDAPQKALPILLENLDNDRARVAMYAFARCFRFTAPSDQKEIIKTLLARPGLKVTVHKEILRLLGEFRIDRDASMLLDEWKKSELHRDVRVAAIHAARRLLDLERAWEILEGAANSEVPEIAKSLLDQVPDELSPEDRARYVPLLIKVASHEKGEVRKAAFSSLCRWSSGLEKPIAEAAKERVLDIEKGTEWKEALFALTEACRDGKAGDAALELAGALARVPLSEQPEAESQRDLPCRQRLFATVNGFTSLPYENRLSIQSLLIEMSDLFDDALLWPLAARLQVASIVWDNPGIVSEKLKKLTENMGNNHFFLEALRESVSSSLNDRSVPWTNDGILKVIDNLLATSEENEHLCIVLLKALGARTKWDRESTERLKSLRKSSYTSIVYAASSIWTFAE